MTYQRRIGNLGEKIAADFLADLGYQQLDANFNTPYGELDLVFLDQDMIVFVEVRSRTSNTYGTPESSITAVKLERVQNAALLWLEAHPESVDDWRIDVVAVLLNPQGDPKDIQHFINASL